MNGKVSLFDRAIKWLDGLQEEMHISNVEQTKPIFNNPHGSVVDILVIDVSGSMEANDYQPSRLDGAKKAAKRFLKRRADITPEGLVGIVKYSSDAKVVAIPLPVKDSLDMLKRKLMKITALDATNISAGLNLATQEIDKIPGRQDSRIILLTDGHSNHGPDPLKTASKLKAKGIQLEIIGIGGSPTAVDEPRLKKMASNISGELKYWFIESMEELVYRFESLALREIK